MARKIAPELTDALTPEGWGLNSEHWSPEKRALMGRQFKALLAVYRAAALIAEDPRALTHTIPDYKKCPACRLNAAFVRLESASGPRARERG